MAENDLQEMIQRIQKTLPHPLSEMSSAELNAHLADVANNPSQYGLSGVGADDPTGTLRANALGAVREQHTAAHTTDLIMGIGLDGVGELAPAHPHAPDPSNIDDLFDPTDLEVQPAGPGAPAGDDDGLDDVLGSGDPGTDLIMGLVDGAGDPAPGHPPAPDPNNIDDLFDPSDIPSTTVPGTPPPMDPELEDLLHQTDALPAPGDPPGDRGVDELPTGPSMASEPVSPADYGAPDPSDPMPTGSESDPGSGGC
ncbi:MAG TPA: hypothetical protein VIH82_07385 [Acidimicrobiia bacterium]